jgi:putative PIN family toxin of toxin-antitoxin system
MKVFFDTNVYVAEALLGRAAERMIAATRRSRWRIYATPHLLDELAIVLRRLGFAARLATLARRRIVRRSMLVGPRPSRHRVARDAADTPILRAALACGADYLVTNDRHLLDLDPYEGLRIVSMDEYVELLQERGMMG